MNNIVDIREPEAPFARAVNEHHEATVRDREISMLVQTALAAQRSDFRRKVTIAAALITACFGALSLAMIIVMVMM